LTAWKSIPIEVAPIAVYRVLRELKKLGSINPTIRTNTIAKAGPLKTDQGFFIVDAPFPPLRLPSEVIPLTDGMRPADAWDVETLSKTIKDISGVLEVGIFSGVTGSQAQDTGGISGQKPVAAYFGMPDGTVTVKKAIY
jgi:ribose 5-phosphate isomerase A